MTAFTASLPLLLLLSGILLLRWSLARSAAVALIAALLVALGGWDLPVARIFSAALRGLFVSLDVLMIVLGALVFMKHLENRGTLSAIFRKMEELSADARVVCVLVAWVFGSFIEGTAGFGTPAAIVAPLLYSWGVPLLSAVAVALVANSTAVTFGAVGTPVRIGLAGLDSAGVAVGAAELNLIAGLLVPVFIVALSFNPEKHPRRIRALVEMVPWALLMGAALVLPAYIVAHVGPEFPSLVGPLIALVVGVVSVRTGFLLPRSAMGVKRSSSQGMSKTLKIFAPYLALLGLLLAGKFALGALVWTHELPGGLRHRFQAFNPGLAFLAVLLLMKILGGSREKGFSEAFAYGLKALTKPAATIFLIVTLVQVLVATEMGAEAKRGMLTSLVEVFSPSALVPMFSVAMGALGSFVAGSATVSNLLMAPLQQSMAIEAEVPVRTVLSLQLVGAAIGNMIALSNILAVEATVGALGNERKILGKVALPFFIYLFVSTFAALLIF